MKLTKFSNLMLLGLTLSLAAAGCKTKTPPLTAIPNGASAPPKTASQTRPIGDSGFPRTGTDITPAPRINTGADTTSTPIPLNTNIKEEGSHDSSQWDKRPEILQPQTIYFDFDKSSVKSSEQAKLDEVVNYLKNNPEKAVEVQGNCDERGTEEYNRSLGERRALAAREYIVRMGIDPSRVDTLTYGEDKPADTGHDESAWSKNRRDDFVVLVPKSVQ